MKPYYEDDAVTIYHGDCREILPTLGPVDLVLTDPPYGINWQTNYSRFSRGSADKSPVAGDTEDFDPQFLLKYPNVILWGANHYAKNLPVGSWMVWDKRDKDGGSFLSDGEIAWWNHGYGLYIRSISGQRHRSVAGGLHPTQKPVGLMHWCIEKAGGQGTVLDPFMGSGTTLRAAKNLGRRAIGIEIEERYCEVAVKRLAQEVLPLGFT